MKDLRLAKYILGMKIIRSQFVLKLLQEEYVNKIRKRFNMDDAKSASTPLASHFWLSKDQSPITKDEMAQMDRVPYGSA